GLAPQGLAAGAVEAQHAAGGALVAGAGDEDAALRDDRRGVAGAWEWRLPLDVLGRRPFERQVGFVSDAVAVRPAPRGPVGAAGAGGQCLQGQDERDAVPESWFHRNPVERMDVTSVNRRLPPFQFA